MTISEAPPAAAPEPGPDPFLRFRLLSLPLFVVPTTALLGILAWNLAPPSPEARRALTLQGALFGFYLGVLLWALIESSLEQVGHSVLRLFGPTPRAAHAFEGVGVTALHLIYELGALISLAWLVSLAFPAMVQGILDRLHRMGAMETDLTPVARVLSFVTTALLGPAMEELVFRGVLFHRMAARWGVRRGLIVSSLIFGLLHGERAAGIFTFGMLMALLYVRSGTLLLPTLCHALNNGFAWVLGGLDPQSNERLTVAKLQLLARPWVAVVALTAPFVFLYFAKRWPARDARLAWPAAPGPREVAATG